MSEKHTPGPWELEKPLFGEQHIYVHSENSVNGKVFSGRQHICVVPYEGKRGALAYHEMFNANALLIAAAPEQHEANKTALMVLCALEKANDWHPNMERDISFAIEQLRAAIRRATGEPK